MAKKDYKAIHRILLKASPKPIYAEPGAGFQMEEKDGANLVKLGAASEVEKKASKTTASKKKADDAEDDDGEDLV